jgi:hypothetical protein
MRVEEADCHQIQRQSASALSARAVLSAFLSTLPSYNPALHGRVIRGGDLNAQAELVAERLDHLGARVILALQVDLLGERHLALRELCGSLTFGMGKGSGFVDPFGVQPLPLRSLYGLASRLMEADSVWAKPECRKRPWGQAGDNSSRERI